MLEILKIIFLFLIAWQLPIVLVRFLRGLIITWFSFICLAIGVTGFVYLMYLI